MKRNTCILFFTTFTLLAQAQQICSRTSVFFDVDKTKLTVETKQKLDSLITLIGESEFLVELYGHTDSLASSIYNLKLAQSRMDAVKEYITLKSKGKLQFKEKNLGETDKPISDSKEKNLAYNRRVDVFLIPMTNGKLKLDGARGEIVEAPPDYFEPCGVCNSAPVVNAYYNAEEGAKANIVFETTDGEPLITFGTIALNKKPCDQIKMRDDTAMCVFKICRGVNTCPTVWDADTIEGKIYWKRSNSKLELNYETGCFVFRGKCGEGHNLDCIATPDYIEPFKGCCIAQPKVFSYTHAFYIDETKVKRNSDITRDTLLMDCKDSAAHLTGFAKMVERYYYLHTVIDSIPFTITEKDLHVLKTYCLQPEMYTEFTFSDTLVRIKKKNIMRRVQFGFYLEEYNDFIPIAADGKKYQTGKKLNADYKYAFIRGKKLYVIEDKNVHLKYSKKRNSFKTTFGRRQKQRFKAVSSYKVPRQ